MKLRTEKKWKNNYSIKDEKMRKVIVTLSILLFSSAVSADNPIKNEQNQSYSKAKKWLYKYVYPTDELRTTLYCKNKFNLKRKIVSYPDGFSAKGNKKRFNRVEAEHVVAISSFAKHYPAYYNSHKECVSKGRQFKGRSCVEKTNKNYRFANADLNLLYPANGLINLLRSNYRFAEISGNPSQGRITGCDIKIDKKNRLVEPRNEIKGIVARTHLYAEIAYPIFNLSSKQRQLFNAWDRAYPVTAEECRRNKIITKLQKSDNPVLKERCG